jgi:hypothetical protein
MGLPEAQRQRWLYAARWQNLLDRAGTSWRRLDTQHANGPPNRAVTDKAFSPQGRKAKFVVTSAFSVMSAVMAA